MPFSPTGGVVLSRTERPQSWRRAGTSLAPVLVGALVLAAVYVTRLSPGTLDSWHYVTAGLEFPQSSWVPLGYSRYGLVLPAWLAGHLLGGDSPATHYVIPFASIALLAAGVFALMRRWFGTTAGVLAVALTFVGTLVWDSASHVYPDIPSIALAVTACLLVQRAGDLRDGHVATLCLLGAGFLLGWAFEIRETTLVTWPFVVWVARQAHVRWSRVLLLLPGMVAWAAADVGISAVAYGDPLLKLHVLLGQDLDTVASANTDYLGRSRGYYLGLIPRMLTDSQTLPAGLWVLVVWAVAAAGVLVPHRRVRLLSAWFLVTLAVFVLQGGVLSPDHPAVRLMTYRYWIAFAVPGAMAAAATVHWTLHRLCRPLARFRRLAVAAAAVALLAFPLADTARGVLAQPDRATHGGLVFPQIRSYLHSSPPGPGVRVWTDYYGARLLPTYSHNTFGGRAWKAAAVLSVYDKKAEPFRPGDLVVFIDRGCPPCTQYLDAFRANRPAQIATWDVVHRSSDGGFTVYRVT